MLDLSKASMQNILEMDIISQFWWKLHVLYWSFFFKRCVTCPISQTFYFCFKRKLFLLHKARKCNFKKQREGCRKQILLFLLKYSVKKHKFFCFVQKHAWKYSGNATVGPIIVWVYMTTFSTVSRLLKFICGGHQVCECPLFRYLKNARMTQRQPCIFLFESATWCSQNKDQQTFSSCSAFARRRQSNMNFSGFEKEKNILPRLSVSQ